VADLSEQPCNKSDNFDKVVTSCQQVVDGLLADLLQDVRFLRVLLSKYFITGVQNAH
jgi:hypothetical protein